MLVDPLKRQPLCSHAGSGGADLVLGFKVDALCFQRPVIDASIDVELSQALVDMACPALPPLFQKLGTVPVPDLLAEAVLASLAHSQHDMGVRLGLAVCSDIAVDVAVGDHAESDRSEEHTSELQSLMRLS